MKEWDILSGNAERDRRNVSLLMQTVRELYGAIDLPERTRRAVDRAIEVTGAERGILLLDDETGLHATVSRDRSGENLPLDERYSRGVVDKVFSGREPHLTIDAANPSAHQLGQSVFDMRLLSIMATPLLVSERPLGVLYVDSKVQAKEFSEADFRVFRALGGLIATSVHNGRLIEAQQEKERMERQLELAHDVQQRLLPADIQAPAGFDMAGVGKSADETSGDYYDVIARPDGRLALVIGDVSGHGVGPAFFMASARALLHALMESDTDPVTCLQKLNAFLCRDMPDVSFMSLFLALLDPGARTLRYASAGHNPPLLRRGSGVMEELEGTGPFLAVLEDATYRLSGAVSLEEGDVLVLYTDGIHEARDEDGEMYGEERLAASLDRHAAGGKDAEGILGGLVDDLDHFRGARRLDDDVTCLVVQVT